MPLIGARVLLPTGTDQARRRPSHYSQRSSAGDVVEHQTVARDAGFPDRRSAERLFHRDLPGGGYVAIELTTSGASRMVRVIVERRAERSRRHGHRPPVILEEDWGPDRGFGELYRLACDNVAIARGLLRLPRAD